MLEKYVYSFWWSVTTLVGKGLVFQPQTTIEQVFSIITVAAGLGLYALVIGNMASVLSKFDRQRQGVRRQLKAVRDLLSKEGATQALRTAPLDLTCFASHCRCATSCPEKTSSPTRVSASGYSNTSSSRWRAARAAATRRSPSSSRTPSCPRSFCTRTMRSFIRSTCSTAAARTQGAASPALSHFSHPAPPSTGPPVQRRLAGLRQLFGAQDEAGALPAW